MPTICKITLDAEEYMKERERVISAALEMKKTLETSAAPAVSVAPEGTEKLQEVSSGITALPEEKKVSVETQVSGGEEVKNLKTAIDTLPKGKTVTVKVEADVSKIAEVKEKTLKASAANETFKQKGVSGFKSVWKEMTNCQGAAKKLSEVIGAAGGAVGIIIAGFAAAFKLVGQIFERMDKSKVESAKTNQANVESMRESAAEAEKMRQATDTQISRLSELSKAEKLSNGQKEEAAKLIHDLTASYGDLGIEIDKTSGRLKGVDAAMIQKLEADKKSRLDEIERERRELDQEKETQYERLDDNASTAYFFQTDGQKQRYQEAEDRIREIDKRKQELGKERAKLNRDDATGDYLRKRKQENEAARQANRDADKAFEQRRADDAFGDEKDIDAKIANRRKQMEALTGSSEYGRRVNELNALRADMKNGAGRMSDAERVEKQGRLNQLEKEFAADAQKVYAWERQIKALEDSRAEAQKKILDAGAFELEQQKLLLAGETEKAASLRLEKQLKEQNLKLTEEEKKALLAAQGESAALNLRKNFKDQASALRDAALRASGRTAEADREKALESAKAAKGGRELTEDEKNQVLLFARLSGELAKAQSAAAPKNAEIRTNELTARGGFASGAVVPEKDRINDAIRANTVRMTALLERIEAHTAGAGII